ncbi:MAG: squalene--hopene cyclase [Chloroflexi bacterium]|nr:squalene--hopene cyclase [Chloroflexota bacterium]
MMEIETLTKDRGLQERLSLALQRSQGYFMRTQAPQGYWAGELESNVTITAEYLLLRRFLGVPLPERERQIANYIRSHQRPDGTWAIWYGGPGDLSTTIEAYLALKVAGISPEADFMRKAREFILARGGIPRARVFTKIWLALFGQFPWKGVPAMPPEVVLLPNWFYLNIYEFACWARGTVVPMLVILHKKPRCTLPMDIQELYPQPLPHDAFAMPRRQRWASWKSFFLALDRAFRAYDKLPWKPGRSAALRRAEGWIVEHQEADGSWGGIQPPWVYSLLALKLRGYPMDHPVMVKGLQGFEAFAIDEGDSWHHQSCVSPVWDTALAVIALADSGLSPDHPALQRSARWLLQEQIMAGGDWQVKNPRTPPGGWAFEFENDLYPDVDDVAEVVIALKKVSLPEREALEEAIERGVVWSVSMQSRNGGWGAFDMDNNKGPLAQIPFADFGEFLDPPSADVTAHMLEMLGRLGYPLTYRPSARGLSYLKKEQEADGAWFGRWGVNYIYGTWSAMLALKAAGEDMGQEYIRRAAAWLKARHNPDGGWGESCDSYKNPSLRGQGPSTASQTAWAIMGLLAAEGPSPEVLRGIRYLMDTQREDGTWEEPYFTGTGFPGDFMINYHLYRNYFPLMALGQFQRALP